jgi:hypothetical protein
MAKEDRFPLRHVAPTSAWVAGETVKDVYTLDLPDNWAIRAANLQVILYDAETVEEVDRWTMDLDAAK